jgi:hypothetical protein
MEIFASFNICIWSAGERAWFNQFFCSSDDGLQRGLQQGLFIRLHEVPAFGGLILYYKQRDISV